jgi:hypothetical protein
MQTVNLFTRKTFKYADGYSHLDDSEYLATVKLTPPKLVQGGDHLWASKNILQHLRLPVGADPKLYAKALEDTMGGSRCRHEYDCCGCATRRIFTRMLSKRDMLVETFIAYNI